MSRPESWPQCNDCGENEKCPAWVQLKPFPGEKAGEFIERCMKLGASREEARYTATYYLGQRSKNLPLGE